jgi:hypothetical protein
VLVRDAKHYIKHFGAPAFKPVLGNGLVTSEGAFWQRQRKLIQPGRLLEVGGSVMVLMFGVWMMIRSLPA